ncbi:hypothetical protein [Flavihumibacter sp. UBA7668]|uniref:hypothetical protein n=1 Tax=Flavihumibacter sp. UBA7668 TaxID=1946542 RepID=UPI0025BD8F35|nr:hypothetical protein [Flavihumibacter sp. UBA7668]
MNEKEFDFNHWDKGLDDLFREAADAEQPAAPPHAWLKMNQLLDEEERKRRRRFAWWWLPLFLFMAGHQHFLPENSSGSLSSQTLSTDKKTAELVKNLEIGIAPNKLNPQEHSESEKESFKNKKQTQLSKADIKTGNPLLLEQSSGTSATRKKKLVQPEEKNANIYKNVILNLQIDQSESNLILLEEKSLYPSMPKTNRISLPVTITVPDPAEPDQKISDSSKPEQETNFRFYIYAGAAADRGFINRNHASDYKLAYGGGIGVQLNKRWAIQAGILQTRKIYEAPGDAYTPKKGSYYDNPNYKIKEVYADCAILEIPVSVRYSFLQNKKQQFFGMLSTQAALMQRESYDYYYTRFGQPAKGYYTYRTNALELFSALGLSVGYERKINDNLHWLIAPYFNLPTSGVGEGAVKLRSAGIFTGLRYSFWKKK